MQNNYLACSDFVGEPIKASLAGGYLRVSNQLMSALCLIKLSDRESRIFNAVMMKTYGFNKSFDWISNSQLEEMTDISKTHISSVKKSLMKRNILIKEGQKVGVNPVISEWIFSKKNMVTPTFIKRQNTLFKVGKNLKQERVSPKQDKKIPQTRNHKKQNNKTKNNITVKSVSTKKNSPRTISFESLPEGISVETAMAFIEHRKLLQAPLTQRAFNLIIAEACKASSIGLTPEQAIDEAIAAGWKGLKLEWIANRLFDNSSQMKNGKIKPSPLISSNIQDTAWADDLGL